MKFDKHIVSAFLVFAVAATLIAGTWTGTLRAIHQQRQDTRARVETTLSSQAASFSEQFNRQIDAIDQALRFLASAWAQDPAHFDLAFWRQHAVALAGLSQDMVLAGPDGVIRQCSVGEAIGQSVTGLDYFRTLSDPDSEDGLFIGPPTIDGIMRQWHMNVARALRNPDGSFAGVIDTDFRLATITQAFAAAGLGSDAFMALIGTDDGRLRGTTGSAGIEPDTDIAATAMFKALRHSAAGIWTGVSATDAIRRIHAFRQIPGRNLMVVVAVSEDDAMAPATVWRQDADLFASFITILLCAIAILVIRNARQARRRDAVKAADRAMLAAYHAQLEVARAEAAAKTERLEATLRGMADGVVVLDAHMCLAEWNAKFAEIAGVPPDILRVGLPVEQVLRAQVASGQFGPVENAEAEVQRRLERLRGGRSAVTQRLRPDGHVLELRRSRLPDGGIITLFSDVTQQKRTEDALRQARAQAEAAATARSGFAVVAGHTIRTPLATLLNTIGLLSETDLSPGQQALAGLATQSGHALYGLLGDGRLTDAEGKARAESGAILINPGLFELRLLLEGSVELLSMAAAAQGVDFRVRIDDDVPPMLSADSGRLRQIVLNLLSYAARHARAGTVWIIAETTGDANQPLRLEIRDTGPRIDAAARAHLFTPMSRPDDADASGAGFGLSISRHLINLMGGAIGCDIWSGDGVAGNAFWLTLPASVVPQSDAAPGSGRDRKPPKTPGRTVSADDVARRRVPRTNILLVEDIAANQFVTAALLRREGHHVDVAESGPAAIHAVKNKPYDIVLMDIFMPDMSGLEATQAIRAIPAPVGAIPVVALTANASADDEVRFRAAGMAGALGKPFTIGDVLETLMTQVWRPAPGSANADQADRHATPAESTTEPVLSATQIQEIRSNLSAEVFLELVEECISDLDHRLPALRRAIAAQVPGAITQHAHAMAGVAAGYGLAALDSKLRAILQAVRDGHLASLDATVTADIEIAFRRAAVALRAVAAADTPAELPPVMG